MSKKVNLGNVVSDPDGKQFNINSNHLDILSIITEEHTSQLNNSDKSTTYEEAAGISFSFDGKEVSISLYETPDLTQEEALQVVEMYANELTEHISGTEDRTRQCFR